MIIGIKNKTQPFNVYKKFTSLANTIQTFSERMQKDILSKWSLKQAGEAILTFNKADFKP
jgi:hypothetical protein